MTHARIHQQGSPLTPSPGDHVVMDGDIYRIEHVARCIQTPGQRGNWVPAEVADADWSGVPEGWEPRYGASVIESTPDLKVSRQRESDYDGRGYTEDDVG